MRGGCFCRSESQEFQLTQCPYRYRVVIGATSPHLGQASSSSPPPLVTSRTKRVTTFLYSLERSPASELLYGENGALKTFRSL